VISHERECGWPVVKLIAIGKIGGYAVRVHGPEATGQFVVVDGKRVYFDFDEHGGPLVVDPRGEPVRRQPVREDDPFWGPFQAWFSGYEEAKHARTVDAYLEAHHGTGRYTHGRAAKAESPVQQALSRRNGGDSRLCSTPIDSSSSGAKGG
jgi:hypothetical protein